MKLNFSSGIVFVTLLSLLASCNNNGSFEDSESTHALWDKPEPPPGDEINRGLWWLYHLQYDESRKSFSTYIDANPKDPLGYFYKTAADWWQLAQDINLEQPKIESQFEEDYQDTVRVAQSAKQSADSKIKARALLCEGGAIGLRGRWFVTRGQWGKAYSMGKKGHKLLKQSIALDPELNDAYLGLGIYDYYTATLPGAAGFFAKVFMGGNKERGLKELHRTVAKASYARVEAMLFLIQINTTFEKKPEKALHLAQELRKEFPHSPAMQIAEINALYETKNWKEGMLETDDFIEKCEKEIHFHSKADLPTGFYYAGMGALFGNKDAEGCVTYMNKIISENDKPSQWVTFAYLRRGQAYDILGKRDLAKKDYKTTLSRKNVWNMHKKANEGLKRAFSLENIPQV